MILFISPITILRDYVTLFSRQRHSKSDVIQRWTLTNHKKQGRCYSDGSTMSSSAEGSARFSHVQDVRVKHS